MKVSIGLAVVVLLIAANPCAEAQNLIVNGNFDSDVSGWTPLGASLSAEWDPSDYAGSPSSGSLLGTNDSPTSANLSVVSCVDSISGGQPYQYTGWIKTPSGQTVTGLFRLYWYWYPLASCAGAQTLAASTPYMTSADDWIYVSTDSEIAPPGTMSAWLVLGIYKTSAVPGTFQVYYDGLDFRHTGINFADGFESGDISEWSAMSCGNDPAPPGGSCPPECTGGCLNNVCIVDCSLTSSCGTADIVCPPNFTCEVECSGDSSCSTASIYCPANYSCSLSCTSVNSCSMTTINCPVSAPCEVFCSGPSSSCSATLQLCGLGNCEAVCTAGQDVTTDCGNACSCIGCP